MGLGIYPDGFEVLRILLDYLVVAAVLAALAYVVLRFGIRDGLRAHTRWLDQRSTESRNGGQGDGDQVG